MAFVMVICRTELLVVGLVLFVDIYCVLLLLSGLLDDIGFNFIKRCIAAVEARG